MALQTVQVDAQTATSSPSVLLRGQQCAFGKPPLLLALLYQLAFRVYQFVIYSAY